LARVLCNEVSAQHSQTNRLTHLTSDLDSTIMLSLSEVPV